MINIDLETIRKLDAMPRNQRVLEAARYYVSMGQRVIPQIGKAPQVKEADASSNLATIYEWFGPGGQYEGKNVGLVLEGCRVLDLDRHDGTDGVKWLGVDVNQLACPREVTPRNGYHIIIADTDLKGRGDKGVDIRTRFTTYPSVVDGIPYRWEVGGAPGRLGGSAILKLGGRQKNTPTEAFSSKFDPLAPASYINFHLEHIDPDADYDTWLKVGMAIHSNDSGYDSQRVWEEWSRGGSKFKEGECEAKWGTFSVDREKSVTIRWLITEAKKNGCPAHDHDSIYYQNPGSTVRDLNEKYGLYNAKGKPYIVSVNHKGEACFSTPTDLEHILANKPVVINGKAVSAAKVWMTSHERREVREIGMWIPGKEPPDSLNTYTGFAIDAVDCNSDEEIRDWLDFCLHDICCGNLKYAEYLWDMLAKKIQNPLGRMGICLVLLGGEGTGKGLLTGTISNIIGPNHAKSISSRDSLIGAYSGDIISNAIFVEAHEASWAGNHTEGSRLKALITEPRLDWNGKFKPYWEQDNNIFVTLTTNDDWAAPAGIDSRRFFVLRTADTRKYETSHWQKLVSLISVDRYTKKINNPEYLGKIRHWLENRKINNDLSRAMDTEWVIKQRKETAIDSREDMLLGWVRATFGEENAYGFARSGGEMIAKVKVGDDERRYVRTGKISQDYRDYVNKRAKNRRSTYDDGTLNDKMALLGFERKMVRRHRIFEGGKPLADTYSDTKTSVMIVPPPDVIEANITKNFSLFAETCDDSDDSDS